MAKSFPNQMSKKITSANGYLLPISTIFIVEEMASVLACLQSIFLGCFDSKARMTTKMSMPAADIKRLLPRQEDISRGRIFI